ncbi:MAG: GH3 auxin-responsive promoter family protein, partial [Candidatus Lokiarchaeota archaeon]|nr:GH3 auxin-responsive promoter family protein [Candidatus Lokiarchaeota archaeon]
AQVLAAIQSADAACRCKAVDFCVVGTYSPKARYVFAVEFGAAARPRSPGEYLSTLDRELRRLNDVYEISRVRRILVEPGLRVLKPGTFHDIERGEMLGKGHACQLKTSRLTNDASMLGLLEGRVVESCELEGR